MTPGEIEAFTAAIIAEVQRRGMTPRTVSAIVQTYEYSDASTHPTASVRFPGDPADAAHQVAVLVGQPLNPGDPVMVMLVPMESGTQVGYVMGVQRPPAPPIGRFEQPRIDGVSGTVPWLWPQVQSGQIHLDSAGLYIEILVSGLYTVTANLLADGPDTTTPLIVTLIAVDQNGSGEEHALAYWRTTGTEITTVSLASTATPLLAGTQVSMLFSFGASIDEGLEDYNCYNGHLGVTYDGPYQKLTPPESVQFNWCNPA